MFEYLKGIVVDIILDKIIIEVNGIGYRINSTTNSASKVKRGDQTIVYTHLVVREDELSLYGFTSTDELSMFQKLTSVSKIGPKVASGILSTYTPSKLGAYILSNDIASIAKSPGVGKKTAERIVLELKDKIDKTNVDYDYTLFNDDNKNDNEAVQALIALGYTKMEGEKAVQAVKDTSFATEEIIKNALKWLMK